MGELPQLTGIIAFVLKAFVNLIMSFLKWLEILVLTAGE